MKTTKVICDKCGQSIDYYGDYIEFGMKIVGPITASTVPFPMKIKADFCLKCIKKEFGDLSNFIEGKAYTGYHGELFKDVKE